LIDQTAAHLREGFQSGRWTGQLPGVLQLAAELMVSKHIVRAALKLLERDGWIEDCGAGRKRKILANRIKQPSRLRIGIMLYAPMMEDNALFITTMLGARHAIEMAGHVCIFCDKYLERMKDNLSRISRCVKATKADAWIVCSGSRVVLEWFAAQPFPVFACGGHFHNLPVACSATSIAPAIESAVNALVDHGHRRIVLLIQTVLRQPRLIPSLESYLAFLESRGIAATPYNLPHFDETAEGLEGCLDGLFRLTPPTAILVHQGHYFAAVSSFLARRGLRVPRDVSVISMSTDPTFNLCLPPVDHFRTPRDQHITRIARWVDGVAKGRPDKRQTIFDAVYVPGGTVGPAKK
jgi:DNA-binding LacI/PurR family transcriptional regulator